MRTFYQIDPKLDVHKFEDVVRRPKVIRVIDFDEEGLEDFEKDMDEAHWTGQPVIPIVVDSFGGSIYAVLGMVASIERARLPVATILTTKAMSAGAVLFCFGTEGYRFMHPHASLMIHDALTVQSGKVEEIRADTRHLDQMNSDLYKRVSRQLGQPADYIRDLIRKNHHVDWFLTAKEAKKHNIANHLRIPDFEVEIKVTISLK